MHIKLFLGVLYVLISSAFPIMIGHVHIAKTGGTSLNGMLAWKFKNVCGAKGYSHTIDGEFLKLANWSYNKKLHYMTYKFSESRFTYQEMRRRGFKNCQYISHEIEYGFWKKLANIIPIELHIPCRTEIDHYLSLCGHKQIPVNNLKTLLNRKCDMEIERFHTSLLHTNNIHVKCYKFEDQFNKYINYIGNILEGRNSTAKYVHRPTNPSRKPDFKLTPKESLRASTILIRNYDYYSFCAACINTENDLFPRHFTTPT